MSNWGVSGLGAMAAMALVALVALMAAFASLCAPPAWASALNEAGKWPASAEVAELESRLSEDAEAAARWVVERADNRGRPFAIVDKKAARLYVFSAAGRHLGGSPVLLGLSVGDQSIPGIASRRPASLAPAERTTPAGRYASVPGHNEHGEDIVWFDYAASLAIHRLRPSPPAEQRDLRMISARSEDRRISFGCVVVPVAFYDAIVRPALGRQAGWVYVLPETRPAADLFQASNPGALTP
jgi:hypothetical protein